MALSIVTNSASQLAADSVASNQVELNQSIAQLSTGKRIVSAADDPAGLAIALQISGLLGGFYQASINASNARGMLQTADGGLASVGKALTTMQQLATEAADGSINSTQLSALDAQYQALATQIDNIGSGTAFNGIQLLQGASITYQVGPTNTAVDQLSVTMPTVSAAGLMGSVGDLTTQANAQTAIDNTTAGLAALATARGSVGAYEQQLSSIGANLQSAEQNLNSALSNIQDANVASTFATFTKQLVLQQAGISVLRQADSAPQQLLALFQ